MVLTVRTMLQKLQMIQTQSHLRRLHGLNKLAGPISNGITVIGQMLVTKISIIAKLVYNKLLWICLSLALKT